MKTKVIRENIKLLSHKDKVRFALFCAKQVVQPTGIPEAHKCIRVVELWLDGKATTDDCKRAAYTADAVAANYAAHAATNVAYAAYAANANAATNAAARAAACTAYACTAYAANDTAASSVRPAQERYLYELIYINDIVEQVLLDNKEVKCG